MHHFSVTVLQFIIEKVAYFVSFLTRHAAIT